MFWYFSRTFLLFLPLKKVLPSRHVTVSPKLKNIYHVTVEIFINLEAAEVVEAVADVGVQELQDAVAVVGLDDVARGRHPPRPRSRWWRSSWRTSALLTSFARTRRATSLCSWTPFLISANLDLRFVLDRLDLCFLCHTVQIRAHLKH